ncbi:hypothetical protein BOX15_Mlig023036g1, partial [Macrostomum lignano]
SSDAASLSEVIAEANEDTLRKLLQESQRRVLLLARTVSAKDKELLLCSQQLEQLRLHAASQSAANIKCAALDPAVGQAVYRLRQELADAKARLEQAQSDLSAWKFTPDSQSGKRLMARIRQMQDENSELSRGVSSGSVAKLETEIALQRVLLQDMRRTQTEQEEFLTEIDSETESLQSTVVQLQSQLTEAYSQIHVLEQNLRSRGQLPTSVQGNGPANSFDDADNEANVELTTEAV